MFARLKNEICMMRLCTNDLTEMCPTTSSSHSSPDVQNSCLRTTKDETWCALAGQLGLFETKMYSGQWGKLQDILNPNPMKSDLTLSFHMGGRFMTSNM